MERYYWLGINNYWLVSKLSTMKTMYHSHTKYIRNLFVANIFIFVILNLSFCPEVYSQPKTKAHKFYTKKILIPILKNEYRNFEFRVIVDSNSYYHTTEKHINKVFRNKKEVAIVDNHINNRSYLFRKDYFKCIDRESLELTKGMNAGDENILSDGHASDEWHYRNKCRKRVNVFFELINRNSLLGIYDVTHYDKRLNINFTRMFDTVINNIPFVGLSRDDTTSHSYNDTTGEFDIPCFYTITYYYNTVEERLQYIQQRPMDYPNNIAKKISEEYKIEINITFEDNRSIIDSIFNFEQDAYRNYTRHNTTDSLPLSWRRLNVDTEVLNDTVIDFPIVSIFDDNATTIRKQEGWTLIYFWIAGCKPCFKTMKTLSENTSEIGLTYMKEQKINFLMINPISGSTESVKRYIENYNLNQYIYHSKGFTSVFKVNVFPTIILISPDKKTFYKLSSLNELPMYIKG